MQFKRVLLTGFGLLFAVSAISAQNLAGDLRARPHAEHAGGVIEVPNIKFSVVNGYRPVTLNLFVPTTGKGPYPVVVFLHGGGWTLDPGDGDTITGPAVLARLAARGYIVARVQYRLSSEAKFPAALTDVKTAIRWLRTNAATYNIDASRVAVWGTSAGGYLAAMVGTTCEAKQFETAEALPERVGLSTPKIDPAASSCVQAVIDWYGPVNFPTMDRQSLPGSRGRHDDASSAESALLGCAIPQCPAELLQAANPLAYVSERNPPFLIMHGTGDHAVPYQQSQELHEALRARGVKTELVLVPEAEHMFNAIPRQQAQEQIDTVFKFIDRQFGTVQRSSR